MFCGTSAKASLLVYEGFNGYTTGTLAGQNANALGLTGAYGQVAASGLNVTGTSLTFGSGATTYQVSGGAASWSANNAGGAGATLNLSSAYSGTLYGSYLINLGANPTSDSTRADIRMNTSATGGTGSSFYSAQTGAITTGNIGIRYNSAVRETASLLAANTTYMCISKWTNLGGTGTGTGTLWFLSSAQYDTLMAAGHLTDAYLDTAVVGTDVTAMVASLTDPAGVSLSSGQALQFVFQSGALNTLRTVDEVKYGTSLLDVTAVPEPTSMALLCGAVFVLFVSVRKRRLNSSGLVGVTR